MIYHIRQLATLAVKPGWAHARKAAVRPVAQRVQRVGQALQAGRAVLARVARAHI